MLLAVLGSASLAGGAALPTVKTATLSDIGKVVVSATGRTLYHTTTESKGKVKCTAACAKQWPPLVVRAGATPVAGAGIAAAKLGTVKRPDGKLQVTYGGFALYLFAGDAKAGDMNGQAMEDTWYALSPGAKIVKASAAAPSSGGLGSSGYTPPSSGGSPGYDPNY